MGTKEVSHCRGGNNLGQGEGIMECRGGNNPVQSEGIMECRGENNGVSEGMKINVCCFIFRTLYKMTESVHCKLTQPE